MTCGRMGTALCGGKTTFCERGTKLTQKSEFRDKLAKLMLTTSTFAAELTERIHGTDNIHAQRCRNLTKIVKLARDVSGLWNVTAGVLPGLLKSTKTIKKLFSLGKGGTVPVGKGLLNEVKGGNDTEKILAIAEQMGKFAGGVTYSIGFGVCRVVKFVGTVGVELSQAAKSVAKSFYVFMFVTHIAGLLSNITGWWRKSLAKERLCQEYEGNDQLAMPNKPKEFAGFRLPANFEWQTENDSLVNRQSAILVDLEQEYVKESFVHALTIVEKAAELVCDTATVFKAAIPVLVQASLGLLVGLLGVSRLFVGGYESADPLAG